MQITRGAAKGLAGQTTVNAPSNWLEGMMVVEPQVGVWYSVAPGLWLMLIILVLMSTLLKRTTFGRYVCALGSNEATARLCGINVSITHLGLHLVRRLNGLRKCHAIRQPHSRRSHRRRRHGIGHHRRRGHRRRIVKRG